MYITLLTCLMGDKTFLRGDAHIAVPWISQMLFLQHTFFSLKNLPVESVTSNDTEL